MSYSKISAYTTMKEKLFILETISKCSVVCSITGSHLWGAVISVVLKIKCFKNSTMVINVKVLLISIL